MLDWLDPVLAFLLEPLRTAPWGAWRSFWLGQIFDDRFLVAYSLPFLPLLLLFSRRFLRQGIVLTGLLFLAYVFGAFYAAFWLVMCIVFHHLSEQYAIECKRTDVNPLGPPLVAGAIIVAWYLATQAFDAIRLAPETDAWLLRQAPWLYPLGVRPFWWEPDFGLPPRDRTLFHTIFWNAHNIGTAYFTIRMLHYFVELRRDTIPKEHRSLLNFLAYLCYAPNLMQGPIERFPDFQEEIATCHTRRSAWGFLAGSLRICWGVSKSLLATFYFMPFIHRYLHNMTYYRHPEQIESYALLYFGVFLHIYWLYLEFSGYCDISAGIARILGYQQVENFNWVWFSTSLRDFWRRWHISLSSLLRDYIYIPLGGNRRHVTLNLIVTFALCGIWHKVMPQLLLWGILMGLMLAINQHWVHWVKRLDESPGGALPALRRFWLRLRPLPQICAWLLTMHAFVFSLLIFFGGVESVRVLKEIIVRPLRAIGWF